MIPGDIQSTMLQGTFSLMVESYGIKIGWRDLGPELYTLPMSVCRIGYSCNRELPRNVQLPPRLFSEHLDQGALLYNVFKSCSLLSAALCSLTSMGWGSL